MKFGKLKSIVMAVVVLGGATSADGASLVSIQQDVDFRTTTITPGPPSQIFQLFEDAPAVTIHDGDSVNLAFNFLNGRLLMADLATNPNTYEFAYPWLALLGSSGGRFRISNIEITLLDAVATGGARSEFTFATQSSGNVQLGPALVDFLPSGSSLSCSGIQTRFTVDFIPGGTGSYKPFLVLNVDQLAITPIPEPATPAFVSLLSLVLCGCRRLCRTP